MSSEKFILTVIIMMSITFLTRAIPFLLFDTSKKSPPKIIIYLGTYLPPAIICAIVVFCFKDVPLFQKYFGLPEFISAFIVVLLHLWKRNTLISIFFGTAVYMTLLRVLH